MLFDDKTTNSRGVVERKFSLHVDDRVVPGLLWTQETRLDETDNPLVLIGHGGGDHKRASYVLAVARLLVREHGFAACAIDGPGHGDRAALSDFRAAWKRPETTREIVADWRGTLDALAGNDRSVGYWGLSMGAMMGIPLLAEEPRIQAAVLGLMGFWGPNTAALERAAPKVQCRIRFLVQWDDEVVSRDSSFELFDALGAQDKTLHTNPGLHAAVPPQEIRTSVGFLAGALKSG
jgi:pimeloyl-ACP methyl ester carboxylesterase